MHVFNANRILISGGMKKKIRRSKKEKEKKPIDSQIYLPHSACFVYNGSIVECVLIAISVFFFSNSQVMLRASCRLKNR